LFADDESDYFSIGTALCSDWVEMPVGETGAVIFSLIKAAAVDIFWATVDLLIPTWLAESFTTTVAVLLFFSKVVLPQIKGGDPCP
jgi:hypothetical protein